MSGNDQGGIYSPLPQSLSDSESEKEIPIARARFVQNENGYVRPQQLTLSVPEVKKVQPAMSAKRKFCFVFSTALCFFTIVVFLWVLPCSESGTCPVRISNWENQHDGIELTGKINAVKSAFKNHLNLALFFKHNLNSPDSGKSGIISVLGNNGAVAWYVNQATSPVDLNCYLIDANGDGIVDCLVLGYMGLEAIDPVSGTIFWHAHNHSQNRVMKHLDFPVRLQDLNRDNINDLLTTKNSPEDAKFVIISGKTGVLEGEIKVEHCDEVHIVEVNTTHVIYRCKNENHDSHHQISLVDLLSKILNRSQIVATPEINFIVDSNPGYHLNGRKLIVNNVGVCPINCRVDISLIDTQKSRTVFSWSYQKSYAFIPAQFSFKPTKLNVDSLKGHVNGYILKLWQWVEYDKEQRFKRYVPKSNSTTVQVNAIMERVVLVTFNSSDFHVINASLTEITQLCFPVDDFKPNCQPSLENQNNSLLISDLDMDGSQELVSYSSTYVRRDDLKENWQLVSNMKVIRLEAELPKLYEVAK